MSMYKQHRRHLVMALLGAGVIPALGGCGFQLRQAPEFKFQKLWLGGSSEVLVYLRKELRQASDRVMIVPRPQDAEVLLQIVSDERKEVSVGQTPSGQVREIQMRATVVFRLWVQGQDPAVTETEIEQFREYSYSETQALAKDDEKDLLFADMSKVIAQQLLWRLTSIQP